MSRRRRIWKPPRVATTRRSDLGSAVLAVGAVAGSYLLVRSGLGDHLDRQAQARVSAGRSRAVDQVVATVTDLGSVYGLAGISGALAGAGHRRLATEVAASGATAWIGAQAAKPLLERQRPYERGDLPRLVAPPAGSSWPSGHAAVVAAIAGSVLPELPRRARPALVAAALGVGLSRLHVGVHHLTDLVAGFGVGVLSSVVGRRVVARLMAR